MGWLHLQRGSCWQPAHTPARPGSGPPLVRPRSHHSQTQPAKLATHSRSGSAGPGTQYCSLTAPLFFFLAAPVASRGCGWHLMHRWGGSTGTAPPLQSRSPLAWLTPEPISPEIRESGGRQPWPVCWQRHLIPGKAIRRREQVQVSRGSGEAGGTGRGGPRPARGSQGALPGFCWQQRG